jgi:hypothetical protein
MEPFPQYLTLSSAASYEYYSGNTNYDFRNRVGRPFPPHGLEIALLDVFYTPVTSSEDSSLDTLFGHIFQQAPIPPSKCMLVECSAIKPQQQADGEFRPVLKMMAIPKMDAFIHSNFSNPSYYPLSETPTVLDCIKIRLLDEAFLPLKLQARTTTTVIFHIRRTTSG